VAAGASILAALQYVPQRWKDYVAIKLASQSVIRPKKNGVA